MAKRAEQPLGATVTGVSKREEGEATVNHVLRSSSPDLLNTDTAGPPCSLLGSKVPSREGHLCSLARPGSAFNASASLEGSGEADGRGPRRGLGPWQFHGCWCCPFLASSGASFFLLPSLRPPGPAFPNTTRHAGGCDVGVCCPCPCLGCGWPLSDLGLPLAHRSLASWPPCV